MPRRTPPEGSPQDADDRGQTESLGVGGILGARAEEIAAAAQNLAGGTADALRRLGAGGAFGIARPRPFPDKFGAEHDVFLSDDGSRVFKHARNHGFGPAVVDATLMMVPCSATGYLARHALMERIFPTDVRVEGLTVDGHFVISQRAIGGGHPTETAIRKYLLKLGFSNVPARFGQGGGAWFHRGLGVLVMDTAPDNFIAARQGIVPVDLQIAELTGEFLGLAAAVESLSRHAPRTER